MKCGRRLVVSLDAKCCCCRKILLEERGRRLRCDTKDNDSTNNNNNKGEGKRIGKTDGASLLLWNLDILFCRFLPTGGRRGVSLFWFFNLRSSADICRSISGDAGSGLATVSKGSSSRGKFHSDTPTNKQTNTRVFVFFLVGPSAAEIDSIASIACSLVG